MAREAAALTTVATMADGKAVISPTNRSCIPPPSNSTSRVPIALMDWPTHVQIAGIVGSVSSVTWPLTTSQNGDVEPDIPATVQV